LKKVLLEMNILRNRKFTEFSHIPVKEIVHLNRVRIYSIQFLSPFHIHYLKQQEIVSLIQIY